MGIPQSLTRSILEDMCVHTLKYVQVCPCMQWQRKASDVWLYHCLLYSLETGFLTEPGDHDLTRLTAQGVLRQLPTPSTGIMSIQCLFIPFFD